MATQLRHMTDQQIVTEIRQLDRNSELASQNGDSKTAISLNRSRSNLLSELLRNRHANLSKRYRDLVDHNDDQPEIDLLASLIPGVR
jgi:restriction endonuclease S subunit